VPGEKRTERLNAEIQECVVELTVRVFGHAERLAQRLSIPTICMKALSTLDAPMAMKELGKRMHCDPSFVTSVADMLEKRGLARREAHPDDRRIKNLVLTGVGRKLKRHMEAELTARMPWSRGLTDDEREQLLALIRKMLRADAQAADTQPGESSLADTQLPTELAFPVGVAPSMTTTDAGSTLSEPPAGEVDITLGAAPAAS
jgi:MarR family transcriptional regulator, organic hydroperoxide resistance regulator